MNRAWLSFGLLLCVACGGSTGSDSDSDGGSSDASTTGDGSIGDDAASNDGGPFACGTATCTSAEYCIHPCCGGVFPLCQELDDAGACPPGTSNDPTGCQGTGNFVCAPPPCTPDPPYCATTAQCGSQPVDPSQHGRDVACVCE